MRQGPVRLRVGALRRPRGRRRCVRHGGRPRRRRPWPEALDAAADALRNVLATLHGPSAIAVLGGADGTNEDAYAWARFAKGVLAHRQRRRAARRRPPGRGRARPAARPRSPTSTAARRSSLLAPDLKEELPVLYLRVRRAAVELGVPLDRRLGSRQRPHAVRDLGAAPPPGRGRRDGRVGSRRARRRDHRHCARSTTSAASRRGPRGPGRRRARPRLGRRAGRRHGRTPRRSSPRCPACGSSRALRRGNVHGALDLGLAPGFLPGRVTLDAGARARSPPRGARSPSCAASTPTGILRAAADGEHRGARAARRRPARRLPRPRAGRAPRSTNGRRRDRASARSRRAPRRAPTWCSP